MLFSLFTRSRSLLLSSVPSNFIRLHSKFNGKAQQDISETSISSSSTSVTTSDDNTISSSTSVTTSDDTQPSVNVVKVPAKLPPTEYEKKQALVLIKNGEAPVVTHRSHYPVPLSREAREAILAKYPCYRITDIIHPKPNTPKYDLSEINNLRYPGTYGIYLPKLGLLYVGSARNIFLRLRDYSSLTYQYDHRTSLIVRLLLYYTFSAFQFYVFESFDSVDDPRLDSENKFRDMLTAEINKVRISRNSQGVVLTEEDKLRRSHIGLGNTRKPGIVTTLHDIATNDNIISSITPIVPTPVRPDNYTSISPLIRDEKINVPVYDEQTKS